MKLFETEKVSSDSIVEEQRTPTEDTYLAVSFLQVTWLCCLVAADLVIDGWGGGEAVRLGGGQELYRRGNQASLVPHGQQGIMVLLPQAPRE